MNDWPALDDFLRTDPRDVGCAQAMEMLHVYVELVAAGGPAEQRYPGIAAHLRACGPCGEDFEGLLAAVRGDAGVALLGRLARGHQLGIDVQHLHGLGASHVTRIGPQEMVQCRVPVHERPAMSWPR